jgi:hypothetical protein
LQAPRDSFSPTLHHVAPTSPPQRIKLIFCVADADAGEAAMPSHTRAPTHSSDAIILASLLSTFLAPAFAHFGVLVVAGHPFMGLAFATVASLYIVPFFPLTEPFIFLFVLISTPTIGWLLSRRGLGHPALFVLAGVIVALLAWSVIPNVFGSSGPLFVGRNGTSTDVARAVCGMAIGGALDGLVYWLFARYIMRKSVLRPARGRS